MLSNTIENTAVTSCKESKVVSRQQYTVTYHIANLDALTLAETETESSERESEMFGQMNIVVM